MSCTPCLGIFCIITSHGVYDHRALHSTLLNQSLVKEEGMMYKRLILACGVQHT